MRNSNRSKLKQGNSCVFLIFFAWCISYYLFAFVNSCGAAYGCSWLWWIFFSTCSHFVFFFLFCSFFLHHLHQYMYSSVQNWTYIVMNLSLKRTKFKMFSFLLPRVSQYSSCYNISYVFFVIILNVTNDRYG